MTPCYRVRVLSSYIYDGEEVPHRQMGRDNRWFHGFVRSLVQNGSGLHEFDIAFVRLPQPPATLDEVAGACVEQGIQLVICAGADAVFRWSAVSHDIPTLYFGGHPDNRTLDVTARLNVSGVRLNLPLIWSFENFSLLGELLPHVRDIFIPVNMESPFGYPDVGANYRLFRRQHGAAWIAGPSAHLGYRSVYFLASRLGCRYHEGPFAGPGELARLLRDIPPGLESAVVGFNDLPFCDEAVGIVLETVRARCLPLFWINNVSIVKAGGVADFSSDFEKVGERLGAMSLHILRDDVPITAIPFAEDPGELFTLNLQRCDELGIGVRDDVRKRFHRVVATKAALDRRSAPAGFSER